jgi:anti-sigma regulatory factor (Ser/Thr protein kinase)
LTTSTEDVEAVHDRDSELCLTIPSRLAAIEPVCEQIRGLLGRRHLEDVEFAVEILARECLNNAILHGNRGVANARVNVGMRIGRKLICLRVTDQGPGFDWRRTIRHGLPADTAVEGRGLMVASIYARRIAFNRQGNQVTLWINTAKEGR